LILNAWTLLTESCSCTPGSTCARCIEPFASLRRMRSAISEYTVICQGGDAPELPDLKRDHLRFPQMYLERAFLLAAAGISLANSQNALCTRKCNPDACRWASTCSHVQKPFVVRFRSQAALHTSCTHPRLNRRQVPPLPLAMVLAAKGGTTSRACFRQVPDSAKADEASRSPASSTATLTHLCDESRRPDTSVFEPLPTDRICTSLSNLTEQVATLGRGGQCALGMLDG
jgi:hypothetical protein